MSKLDYKKTYTIFKTDAQIAAEKRTKFANDMRHGILYNMPKAPNQEIVLKKKSPTRKRSPILDDDEMEEALEGIPFNKKSPPKKPNSSGKWKYYKGGKTKKRRKTNCKCKK